MTSPAWRDRTILTLTAAMPMAVAVLLAWLLKGGFIAAIVLVIVAGLVTALLTLAPPVKAARLRLLRLRYPAE